MLRRASLLAGLVGSSCVAALALQPAAALAASPPRPFFEMPFPCGQVRNGATYSDHGGPGNHYPIDFNRGSGDTDLGDPVLASAGGRAQVWTEADGDRTIRIHHNRDWATDYQHLSRFLINDGDWVTQGQLIGRVGKSGTGSAHLHYEQRRDGVAVQIYFHGRKLDPDYSFVYNGPEYTSRNCKVKDNSVSAVAGGEGQPLAFARAGGGSVIWKERLPGGWSAWRNIGGNIQGNPDVTSRYAGQLHVFARGAEPYVYHRSRTPGGNWSTWNRLSGFRTPYPPAAVAPDRDTLMLFAVRASDHRLLRRVWRAGSGWTAWTAMSGGGNSSGPDASVRPGGTVDLVIRGDDGRVHHRAHVPGSGWKAWSVITGGPVTPNGAAPSVASRKSGSVDLMVRAGNGTLHRRVFTAGSGWGGWNRITEINTRFNQGPDLLAGGSGTLHVFGRDANGHAVWLTWDSGRPAGDKWTAVRTLS